jgi:hypothetical protein
VLLVVNWELKIVKLILYNKEATTEKTAMLYMKYIYCNYELLVSIVSDQDTQFNLEFWKVLWKLTETTLHIGAARHPKTDNQTEYTIQTIKWIIQMYLNKTEINWLEWFLLTEFWYNSAIHTSIDKSPFEVV